MECGMWDFLGLQTLHPAFPLVIVPPVGLEPTLYGF